jgi:hypothetical protein
MRRLLPLDVKTPDEGLFADAHFRYLRTLVLERRKLLLSAPN